jgi:uncharacterized membrane protein YfcA
MEGILLYITIAVVSTFANILSQLAGGGTSLVNIPALILLGVDPRVAIASIKMSSIGGVTALPTYIKNNKVVWKYIPFFIAISIFSALGGGYLLLSLDSDVVQRIIGILILLLLPVILLKKKWGLVHNATRPKWLERLGILVYLIVAVLQSAFASGMGLFATFTLVTFFGYSLVHANATRRIALIVQNFIVFIVLFAGGLVDIGVGLALLVGSLAGNFLGAKLVIYKGSSVVKVFFILLIIISAIKLLI